MRFRLVTSAATSFCVIRHGYGSRRNLFPLRLSRKKQLGPRNTRNTRKGNALEITAPSPHRCSLRWRPRNRLALWFRTAIRDNPRVPRGFIRRAGGPSPASSLVKIRPFFPSKIICGTKFSAGRRKPHASGVRSPGVRFRPASEFGINRNRRSSHPDQCAGYSVSPSIHKTSAG